VDVTVLIMFGGHYAKCRGPQVQVSIHTKVYVSITMWQKISMYLVYKLEVMMDS